MRSEAFDVINERLSSCHWLVVFADPSHSCGEHHSGKYFRLYLD